MLLLPQAAEKEDQQRHMQSGRDGRVRPVPATAVSVVHGRFALKKVLSGAAAKNNFLLSCPLTLPSGVPTLLLTSRNRVL